MLTKKRKPAFNITESWNHRMACVGKDLKYHLIPTLLPMGRDAIP